MMLSPIFNTGDAFHWAADVGQKHTHIFENGTQISQKCINKCLFSSSTISFESIDSFSPSTYESKETMFE